MTWLYWLHFVFLAALIASVVCLTWLARVHDRD
jgi:hypothetical protein